MHTPWGAEFKATAAKRESSPCNGYPRAEEVSQEGTHIPGCRLHQRFSSCPEGDESRDRREEHPDHQEPPPVQLDCEVQGYHPHLEEGDHLQGQQKGVLSRFSARHASEAPSQRWQPFSCLRQRAPSSTGKLGSSGLRHPAPTEQAQSPTEGVGGSSHAIFGSKGLELEGECRGNVSRGGQRRWSHRITAWWGWKGPLWVTQPNPLPKQGHPEQGAQHHVQAGLEYLQRRRLHSPSG